MSQPIRPGTAELHTPVHEAKGPQPQSLAEPVQIDADTHVEPEFEIVDPWADRPEQTRMSAQGQASSVIDLFENNEIINPWAAPSLEEVAAGARLERHQEGDSVYQIQVRLRAQGLDIPQSGVMDQDTLAQIAVFKSQHLVPDDIQGEFDGASLDMLERLEAHQAQEAEAVARLKAMPTSELRSLGRKDPEAFFKALMPAALESERQHNVPAVLTLAQAALESDWARRAIGGYNLFGIKGAGPAGTVEVKTREVDKEGNDYYIQARFADFNNFYEAVKEHGEFYHNGNFDEAVAQYGKDGDALAFIDNISPTYATDPQYAWAIKKRINDYQLTDLVEQAKRY